MTSSPDPMKKWSRSELALASFEVRGFGDDHEFEKGRIGISWRISKVCFHMVSKSFYLVRIGRPDMLWPACSLARATTYAKLVISFINFTSSYRQCCHVRHTALECRLDSISRLGLCRRPHRPKVNVRRNVMHLSTSHTRTNWEERITESIGCVRPNA